jgi:hypothetical protein
MNHERQQNAQNASATDNARVTPTIFKSPRRKLIQGQKKIVEVEEEENEEENDEENENNENNEEPVFKYSQAQAFVQDLLNVQGDSILPDGSNGSLSPVLANYSKRLWISGRFRDYQEIALEVIKLDGRVLESDVVNYLKRNENRKDWLSDRERHIAHIVRNTLKENDHEVENPVHSRYDRVFEKVRGLCENVLDHMKATDTPNLKDLKLIADTLTGIHEKHLMGKGYPPEQKKLEAFSPPHRNSEKAEKALLKIENSLGKLLLNVEHPNNKVKLMPVGSERFE